MRSSPAPASSSCHSTRSFNWPLTRDRPSGVRPRLLMIPDLVTAGADRPRGQRVHERQTTQMLHVETDAGTRDLLDRLGLPSSTLRARSSMRARRRHPAENAGGDHGLAGVPVTAVATHDTGSAVAGTPLDEGWAYISSGTWSLVGHELSSRSSRRTSRARTSPTKAAPMARRGSSRTSWGSGSWSRAARSGRARASTSRYDRLLEEVAAIGRHAVVISRRSPAAAPAEHADALGGPVPRHRPTVPETPSGLARIVLDSLALRYASVFGSIPALTDTSIRGVRVVGGGSQNAYLNQATATTTGLPVAAGPSRRPCSAMSWCRRSRRGRFDSLAVARRYAAAHRPLRRLLPRPSPDWREARSTVMRTSKARFRCNRKRPRSGRRDVRPVQYDCTAERVDERMGRLLVVRPDAALEDRTGRGPGPAEPLRRVLRQRAGSAPPVRDRAVDVLITAPATPGKDDLALAARSDASAPQREDHRARARGQPRGPGRGAPRARVRRLHAPLDYGEIVAMARAALDDATGATGSRWCRRFPTG